MYQGVLTKMKSEWVEPVQYYLSFEHDFLVVNTLLHKTLRLTHLGYQCLGCGAETPVFRQGYCKKCFFELPSTADWVMRPELSTAHLDIPYRDLDYEKSVQLQPHIVYLAQSSHLKVGVTRKTQVPTRWIDQGAHLALPILETPNRYWAGVAEVALKSHYSDKTQWRKMLQHNEENVDLVAAKNDCLIWLPDEVKPYVLHHQTAVVEIDFPVLKYPQKPQSLNLVKAHSYEGKLVGIKGQYLIFEDEQVFNVRSNEGLVVAISVH